MKACSRCGDVKPLDAFSPDIRATDGLASICIKCNGQYSMAWARKNKERMREIKRSYRARHAGRIAKAERAAKEAEPEKYKARYSVFNAKRAGKIPQLPCAICGSLNTQAHHCDYSKPLDVIWLCQVHHAEVHKKQKETI